jgi:glycosyltransferase involved in cell wall biosynthesis
LKIDSTLKIVVITSGLRMGGAETLLLNIVKKWLNEDVEISIFSLSGVGALDDRFREIGVDVHNYNLDGFCNKMRGIYQLSKDLRFINPVIVQTWMPHADLVGGLITKMVTSAELFWGLHHANFSLDSLKLSTLAVAKMNALLSYFVPDCIIAVSQHVKVSAIEFGFNKNKFSIIENGIDFSEFRRNEDSKKRIFDELKIGDSKKLIGFVGRYSLEKRPSDFLQLASQLNQKFSDLHFVMAGDGNDKDNQELLDLIEKNNLSKNISLLGVRNDMPEIFSSLDVLVSTSVDEAFGLVLVEALACGCPCVSSSNRGAKATGDQFIKLAEVADIDGFCNQVSKILGNEIYQNSLSEQARKYVFAKFNIESTAKKYLDLYYRSNPEFKI